MSKEIILDTIRDILGKAGFSGKTTWVEGAIPRACVVSEEILSALIGRQGQNLGAFEHLVRVISTKKLPEGEPLTDFILDVNNYRKTHADELITLARMSADRVVSTGRAESLSPMNAFERKIVHTELSTREDLETQSIGTEPNRRVVIKRVSF